METTLFKLPGTDLVYNLRLSNKSKKLKIVINQGKIELVVPKRVSKAKAVDFLLSKKDWIVNTWHKVYQNNTVDNDNIKLKLLERKKMFYLGQELDFAVKQTKTLVPHITINESIVIYVPNYKTAASLENRALVCLTQYLTKELTNIVLALIKTYTKALKVDVKGLKIKNLKSKWGSCSSKHNININIALIFAPLEIIEYVVIHELCHIKYFNHSKAFWNLVNSVCPNYKKAKIWLKKNQFIISYL